MTQRKVLYLFYLDDSSQSRNHIVVVLYMQEIQFIAVLFYQQNTVTTAPYNLSQQCSKQLNSARLSQYLQLQEEKQNYYASKLMVCNQWKFVCFLLEIF